MPRAVLAGVLVALLSASSHARPAADELSLSAVRFYRLDHRHTRVTAFLDIPVTLVTPVSSDASEPGRLCYEVDFRLEDSAGGAVDTQTWRTRLDGTTLSQRRHLVETMEFLIPAGRFRLIAAVRDSASGREGHASLALEGFATAPLASDLLLSPDIRAVSESDSVPNPGELRRGRTLITAATVLQLNAANSAAHYLLEAYGPEGRPIEGTMRVRIRDSGGTIVRRTRPFPVEVQPGGSVLRGRIDAAGLAPGRYEFTVIVSLGGETVERSSTFVMEASAPTASSSRN
ncbi:MAG TPA: hypothetical protein VFS11_01150 [Gemmatimonadales bacterium]|nr:hypothetical protein [Gemmatimonadales bacterium]